MDRNNNVIRTKPIGITSDDKFPVSYQSANTFFHFVNKFNYLNEMISDKKIYPRYCKESLEYLDLFKIIYVFLTIFLYLLKCPQSLILSALRAFCFCGKPHISRSIFLYFRYQAWLKSW